MQGGERWAGELTSPLSTTIHKGEKVDGRRAQTLQRTHKLYNIIYSKELSTEDILFYI